MRYFSFLAAVLLPFLLLAQAPQAFDFQGVARDASGNVLSSQAIGLRISILTGSPTGDLAYQETHSVITSPFGLFTIQVGNGTPTQSTFPSIGWGASSHFIQVEMDASGGSSFTDMGTTQLLSVPYALHAKAVDCFSVSLLGDTLKQGNGCFVIIPGVSAANGGCLDQDGDGFYDRPGCGPVDCDDAQATVYPGAPEICGDGLDNDCDGGVDNAPDVAAYVPWYFDADEDGYGDAAVSQLACAQPTGYVSNDQDCDDSDAGRFPGQGCSLVCSLAEQAWIDQNMGSYLDQVFFIWANCFGEAPNCVEQQLVELELSGTIPLSLNCHSCAIAYVECIEANCLLACATDPLGLACSTCIATSCRQQFITCAGLIDADGDGWSTGSDCDDSDPNRFPGAPEACDGIDNNCNGQVDEGVIVTWYLDLDGDGYGAGVGITACDAPGPEYVDNGFDCDDNDPNVFPYQGCPGFDCGFFYGTDQGVCGFGTICDNGVCVPCEDLDGDGFTVCDGDCDDNNAAIFPGAVEDCNNGVDDNCDGQIDEECPCIEGTTEVCGSNVGACQQGTRTCMPGGVWGGCIGEVGPTDEICNGIDDDCDGEVDEDPVDGQAWYRDADGDGYGVSNDVVSACSAPAGYVENQLDCDDNDPAVNTAASELCDGIDNNCDGQIDEGCAGFECGFFNGTDQGSCAPGFGCVNGFCVACTDNDGDGFTNCDGDCNDNDPTVFPGATEVCGDGIDNNCDGQVDEGCPGFSCGFFNGTNQGECGPGFICVNGYCVDCADNDGDGFTTCDGDCNDNDPTVFPGAAEVCGDGIDNNCDGQIDEGCTGFECGFFNGTDQGPCGPGFICVNGYCVACTDNDGDGFTTCDGDCNDNDPTVFPGAAEVCDGIDNNCDGQVDEGFNLATDTQNCGACGIQCPSGTNCVNGVCMAVDLDEDGFGSDVDCDDTNADVNPGAVEVCDGIDDDCDGQVDEGFNFATDTQNCGACGIQCPPGFSCVNGQCVE